MLICQNCKQQLLDGTVTCPNCGASVSPASDPTSPNPISSDPTSPFTPAPDSTSSFTGPSFTALSSTPSASIIAPRTDPASPPSPKKFTPPVIVAIIASVIAVVATIIAITLALTKNNSGSSATYTIPVADQVTPSSTTTAWLGNYFFSIPDTYHFELGLDNKYESIYLQSTDNPAVTLTEISYLDDISFQTISAGSTIPDFAKKLVTSLEATNSKVSATAVSGINFYYMDFVTPDGSVLLAFSPAEDSSFLTTVTGDGSASVEQRLAPAASILATVKQMPAAAKGVPDNVGDIVNSGALLQPLQDL